MGSTFSRKIEADLKKCSDWDGDNKTENKRKFEKLVVKIFTNLQTNDPFESKMEERKKAGDEMAKTDSIQIICDKLADSFETKEDLEFVDNALVLLQMLTEPECSADVCSVVALHERLLPLLVSSMNKKPQSLAIIHNLVVNEAELKDGLAAKSESPVQTKNQFRLHLNKIQEKLQLLAKSGDEKTKLLATVALACIRDSSLEPDLVRFMFIHLCLALDEDQKNLTSDDDDDDDDKGKPAKDKKEGKKKQKSASDNKEEAVSDKKNKSASDDKKVVLSYDEKEHRSSNCSATAMERGVRHQLKLETPINAGSTKAAKGNGTRQKLIQYGIVSLLGKGAMSKLQQERTACIESLWYLCRDETCKLEMVEDEAFIDLLFKLNGNTSDPSYEQAAFILTNLWDHLKKKPKHLYLKNQESKESAPHVMLSYQTNSRHTILEIKQKLDEQGIKTWMDQFDIRKYRGALEAMADGVENCGVFLMGVSRKYQESLNCKQEAKYAFVLQKTIIPLKLEENFTPSSWLGIIQGSDLYYDCTETNRDAMYTDLIKEIKREMKKAQNEINVKEGSAATSQTSSTQAGGETKGNTLEKDKDVTQASQAKSPRQQGNGAGKGKVTRRGTLRGKSTPRPAGGGSIRRSLDDRSTPRQQPLPYQNPKPLSLVIPYCRLHPTSTCNAKGDGYNHCCCHVEDPRKEVRDWLKRHRLDGNDSISSLTKKDLLSLVCLKNEAPDFFYQRIWNDLKMKKFSEIENFKAALVDWEEEEED
ncbi:uncharacterized protein [Littorina saxatilis]|uniref:uncharacterized protein isoform X2 n=1 Tax=Littorina saxatilis TaxID=31220 RepID=UPI0038B60783